MKRPKPPAGFTAGPWPYLLPGSVAGSQGYIVTHCLICKRPGQWIMCDACSKKFKAGKLEWPLTITR